VEEKGAETLESTLGSLQRQTYPNWSLTLVGTKLIHWEARPILRVDDEARAAVLWEGLESADLVFPVLAGDVIADYAMAALVEFASRHPHRSMFYADEDSIDAKGQQVAPELKPDWSPIFHRTRPYVGRAVYFRRQALEAHADFPSASFLRPSTWDTLLAAEVAPVGHIRRILLTKPRMAPEADAPVTVTELVAEQTTATLIVPTRDRADLLSACLSGLEKTRPRECELLIIDNGSKEPAARNCSITLARTPGFGLSMQLHLSTFRLFAIKLLSSPRAVSSYFSTAIRWRCSPIGWRTS
jgi:hypothetical protein